MLNLDPQIVIGLLFILLTGMLMAFVFGRMTANEIERDIESQVNQPINVDEFQVVEFKTQVDRIGGMPDEYHQVMITEQSKIIGELKVLILKQ